MESLIIFILIAAGSAFVNWLKRRGETDWTDVEQLPQQPRPKRTVPPPSGHPHAEPPQPKVIDWEAELRRMLQGDQGTIPAPPPPPPIIKTVPQPVYEAPAPPRPRFQPPVFERKPAPVLSGTLPEEGPETPVTLNRANIVYERASHLDETVTSHLDHITKERVGTPHISIQRGRGEDAQKIVTLLRNPKTARQALLASFILSPPKSLENS